MTPVVKSAADFNLCFDLNTLHLKRNVTQTILLSDNELTYIKTTRTYTAKSAVGVG